MPEYIQPTEMRTIRRVALEQAIAAQMQGPVTDWARTFEIYILTGKTFKEQQEEEKVNG